MTLGAIAAVIAAGSYLTGPLFRFIAAANLRELFVAAALMIVVGIALLMTLVGLSPALGTFLAGVVLANSEYRHELESDIDPFKGLLLGLFFMTVGAGINFGLLGENLALIIGLTLGLIVLKALILYGLAVVFKLRGSDRWLLALGLALFILYDRVIVPRYIETNDREADEMPQDNKIVIAGHGRVGGLVSRILHGAGFEATVIDFSSVQIEMLKKFGARAYYGDATRPDLLHATGIAEAKLFVIAIDGKDQITELVRYVGHHYPNVHISARAVDRNHVYDLWHAGCRDIIRETYDSSLRMGRSAFEALGANTAQAQAAVDAFSALDRKSMVAVAAHYDPDIPSIENQAMIDGVHAQRGDWEAELAAQMKAALAR